MYLDISNSKTVEKLINRYGYYFYLINCNAAIKCTCLDPITKDPNLKCKKCLGLGYKIKIRKVFGAIRETKEREVSIAQTISITPKIVYIKGLVHSSKDDLVIDNESIYRVFTRQYHKGEHGEFGFTRLTCPTEKSNHSTFIRNFRRLMANDNKIFKK